ncbi:MAG: hypothetical protein JW952_04990 [Candidatus Eisenbacteria bacterium]|nr:hypothetical protein [Candidatus Eisenbacteria bacterium]
MAALHFTDSGSYGEGAVRGGKLLVVAAAILLAWLSPRVSLCQSLPDIPLVYDFGVGARAMGMGQAHVAVCDDVSATFYNPAALAHVRRIELSAGFSHLNDNWQTEFYGTRTASEVGSTKLSSLALAYPFPTYRGSLVFGVAYNRSKNLDSDYMREGFNPYHWRDDLGDYAEGFETETVYERGGMSHWTVAMGADVSAEVSVGGSISFLSGSSERTYEYDATWTDGVTNVEEYYYQLDDADITGWTASVGTVARIGNAGRVGLTVNFPQYLTLDGSQYLEEYDPVGDLVYIDDILFEDEITLPLSFSAGASAAPVAGLILALDARYTDWKQIDYYGPIRLDNEYAYKATTSIRLGAEFTIPNSPLRVRAGYFTDPVAFRFIEDYSEPGGVWDATIDQNGRFFTFGAGLLVEDAFTVDAAWVHGGYEKSLPRRSDIDYSEERTSDRMFVTASFRF